MCGTVPESRPYPSPIIRATMKLRLIPFLRVLCLFAAVSSLLRADSDDAVPTSAPRTLVLAGRQDAFRTYVTTGEGAAAFNKLRADFDRDYLALPLPPEPLTYGDPSPSKRTSEIADRWRDVQDLCGLVAGVAEAATLCWIVTGEEKYLNKAREFLIGTSRWHLAPDWKNGPVVGATDIRYNDEGHFRLWRKLPLVYDQLRDQLSPTERTLVLDHFHERGHRSVEWIKEEGNISNVTRNSIRGELSSHPIRFMPMTGLAALALWDDLPEARDWWTFAYQFYRDRFTPWGGDDGGWAEGVAYWRGTIEPPFSRTRCSRWEIPSPTPPRFGRTPVTSRSTMSNRTLPHSSVTWRTQENSTWNRPVPSTCCISPAFIRTVFFERTLSC